MNAILHLGNFSEELHYVSVPVKTAAPYPNGATCYMVQYKARWRRVYVQRMPYGTKFYIKNPDNPAQRIDLNFSDY